MEGALEIGILALLGLFAGVINTVVGGGTYLVLPLLIFLQVDPLVANGTNRLCVAFQTAAAAGTLRSRTRTRAGGTESSGRASIDGRTVLLPGLLALAGGVPGAWLASVMDPERFRGVVGWALLAGVALLFLRRPLGSDPEPKDGAAPHRLPPLGVLGAFLCGVYGGFLGAGIGVVIMLFLTPLLRLDLVRMLQVKVLMVLAMSASASAVYLWRGKIDWPIAAVLIPAYVLGASLGARLALRGGEPWIRRAVAVVALLLAVLLILGVRAGE